MIKKETGKAVSATLRTDKIHSAGYYYRCEIVSRSAADESYPLTHQGHAQVMKLFRKRNHRRGWGKLRLFQMRLINKRRLPVFYLFIYFLFLFIEIFHAKKKLKLYIYMFIFFLKKS